MQQPIPVDALKDPIGKRVDFGIAEVGAAGENAADENGGVDRGNLGLKDALAVLQIEEMAEKAVSLRYARFDKTQSIEHALANTLLVLPAAVVGNTQGRQAETGGGDAGDVARIGASGLAAIFDEAAVGVGFLPEKLKAGTLHLVE